LNVLRLRRRKRSLLRKKTLLAKKDLCPLGGLKLAIGGRVTILTPNPSPKNLLRQGGFLLFKWDAGLIFRAE